MAAPTTKENGIRDDTLAPYSDTLAPNSDTLAPNSDTLAPDSDTLAPDSFPRHLCLSAVRFLLPPSHFTIRIL